MKKKRLFKLSDNSLLKKILKNIGLMQFMKRTLMFLFFFVIEVLILNLYIDYTFEPDIPSALFLEFRAPLILFFAALAFYVLARHKLAKIAHLKKFDYMRLKILLPVNILFFAAFFKLNLFMMHNPYAVIADKIFFSVLWYALAFGLFVSLFIAFFREDYVISFIKNFKKEIAVSILIAYIFRFTYQYFSQAWQFFSGIVSAVVFFILRLTYPNARVILDAGAPVITAGKFSAKIFSPCSGIEGMTLFLTLFIIMMIIEWKFINKYKAATVLVLGTVGAFLLNILRVYLIFLLGAIGYPDFAIGFFHSNVGWILFSVYFIVVEFLTYNWIRKDKVKTEKDIKL